jgi:broad specificity phosphatase PhoE
MGKIYLLRHGETDYHVEKRLVGRKDVSINETGREQARRAGEYFDGVELSAIYCSPLKRCRETAQPVADNKGLEVQVMDGLIEVEMGEWDGQLVKDLFLNDKELLTAWMRNPSSVTLPGGEDFGAVRDRTALAMEEITRRHAQDGAVLVVSHGGPIRTIICQTLKMDIDNMLRIEIDLASISSIAFFEGGIAKSGIVSLVNDTSHLKQ